MNINETITRYRVSRNAEDFRIIYDHVVSDAKKNIRAWARRYQIDEHDVQAVIDDKILEVVEKYDPNKGKFRNNVFKAIVNGCIDESRARERKTKKMQDVMIEDDFGDLTEIYETVKVAPTTDEDSIIEEIQKKNDQRQLIAHLLMKADASTTQSISAYLSNDTYRQAAKQVGTCHKTVKGRIRRLAKLHDTSVFGEYHDYFTVPTSFVG